MSRPSAGESLVGVDSLLEAAGAAALLIVGHGGADPDLARFAGDAHLGDALVLIPRGQPPRLGYFTPMERGEAESTGLGLLTPEELDIARFAREGASPGATLGGVVARALQLAGVAPGPIALAGSWAAGPLVEAMAAVGADGWPARSGNELALRLRKRKTAAELDEILRVTEVTCAAFREVAARLAAATERDGELWLEGERLTIGRLRSDISRLFAAHRLVEPRGNIVAPGADGGVPHTAGDSGRVLAPGESLVVDLFPRGRLFSDCTRTFCVGPAPESLLRAHASVLMALRAAHDEARPGVRGWTLQELACRRLGEAGYPTPISHPGTLSGYVHGLGHGVGYELHEYPSFKQHAGEEGVLEAGDVVTLEPGLYDPAPGGYGVRLEDLVVIGDAGHQNWTPLPYDLDPRAWR